MLTIRHLGGKSDFEVYYAYYKCLKIVLSWIWLLRHIGLINFRIDLRRLQIFKSIITRTFLNPCFFLIWAASLHQTFLLCSVIAVANFLFLVLLISCISNENIIMLNKESLYEIIDTCISMCACIKSKKSSLIYTLSRLFLGLFCESGYLSLPKKRKRKRKKNILNHIER